MPRAAHRDTRRSGCSSCSASCARRRAISSAERLMRSSLAAAPGRADFHANLGNLRSRQQPQTPEFAYRSALQLAPTLRTARLGLARLLCDAGFHAAAATEARTLIAADARDAEAWSVLGVALRGQGEYAEAEASYRKALRDRAGLRCGPPQPRRPAQPSAACRGCAWSNSTGPQRPDSADANCPSTAAVRSPTCSRFDEAEQSYLRALATDPAHVDSQIALAKLRYMRGDPDFAREFRQAAERQPRNLRLADGAHGQVLRMAGDAYRGGAQFLRELLHNEGFVPEVASALAVVLHGRAAWRPPSRRAGRANASPENPALDEALVGVLLSQGEALTCLPIIRPPAATLAPLDQRWIAYEATALRLLGDDGYHELYNFDRLRPAVRARATAAGIRPRSSTATCAKPCSACTDPVASARPEPAPRHAAPRSLLVESTRSSARSSAIETPDRRVSGRHSVVTPGIRCPRATRRPPADRLLVGATASGRRPRHHTRAAAGSARRTSFRVPPRSRRIDSRSGWIKFGEPGIDVPGDRRALRAAAAGHASCFSLVPLARHHADHGDEPG